MNPTNVFHRRSLTNCLTTFAGSSSTVWKPSR